MDDQYFRDHGDLCLADDETTQTVPMITAGQSTSSVISDPTVIGCRGQSRGASSLILFSILRSSPAAPAF